MNAIIKKNGIQFGVLTAIISSLYTFGAYAINEELFAQFWISIVIMLVAITFFVVAAVKSKKMMGGFITFRESFSAFMIAAIVYLVIVTALNMLLFHVIDPDLGPRLQEMIIEKSYEMYEQFNMSQEQIDQAIARIESQDSYSVVGQLKGVVSGIIFFAVFGIISSLIIRKNKPMWANNIDQNEENA